MIVSQKRIEANRLNAQKSTGPRTPEGKGRSRENAVKHGLTAQVMLREDAVAMQEEAQAMFDSLRPRNKFQVELVDQVALINIRTRRAQRIERRMRERLALRAMTSWDDDRRLDAERLGATLAARPAEVVALLKRTPQGCDWLINRWAMLAHRADSDPGWTAEQARLAFDLLGTPEIFRVGAPGLAIDTDGRVVDPDPKPADVARGQIAGLRESREVAEELDGVDRELAECDLVDEDSPELRRLRRYEASLHKRLRWCLAELKVPLPEHRTVHDLRPIYVTPTDEQYEAEVQAEMDERIAKEQKFAAEYYANKAREQEKAEARESRRPLALEQNEATSEAPNEPTIEVPNEPTFEAAPPRVDARLRQAEARREAKKRKLERLRA